MLFWKSKKEKKIDQTEIENVIRGLTRNAISVEVVSNGATTLSGSRIGGRPYVTCNFSWPTFTGENYDIKKHKNRQAISTNKGQQL